MDRRMYFYLKRYVSNSIMVLNHHIENTYNCLMQAMCIFSIDGFHILKLTKLLSNASKVFVR